MSPYPHNFLGEFLSSPFIIKEIVSEREFICPESHSKLHFEPELTASHSISEVPENTRVLSKGQGGGGGDVRFRQLCPGRVSPQLH